MSLLERYDALKTELKDTEKQIKKDLKAGKDVPGFELITTQDNYYLWPLKFEIEQLVDRLEEMANSVEAMRLRNFVEQKERTFLKRVKEEVDAK